MDALNGNAASAVAAIGEGSVWTTTTIPNFPMATIGCDGSSINLDDVASTLNDMGAACDGGTTIPSHDWLNGAVSGWITYSDGDAMSYACSSGGENPCSSDEVTDFTGAITSFCQGQGGWAYIDEWAKTYGYTAAGGDMQLKLGTSCEDTD